MANTNEQNTENNEDRLFRRTPWHGVSCASHFWPYGQRPEIFETRRAVANLTHGLQYALATGPLGANDELSANDVLIFLKAANDVRRAADMTLSEIVAEAISRGATWKQIGEVLGIQRTAAQKRFGKGLPEQRKSELKHEALGCLLLYAYWTGQISVEDFGFDASHWEATTIETTVDHAIRTAMKAANLHMEHMSELDEGLDLEELHRVYSLIRNSLHALMIPETLATVASYSRTQDSWVDTNAVTYFVQAACRVAFAFNHFNKLWSELEVDPQAAGRRIMYIHRNFLDLTLDLSHPEVIHLFAKMEEAIVESGNTVYTEKQKAEGFDFEQMEVFSAIWRKDKEKIAEFLGVDELEDIPSLDELLDLIASTDE